MAAHLMLIGKGTATTAVKERWQLEEFGNEEATRLPEQPGKGPICIGKMNFVRNSSPVSVWSSSFHSAQYLFNHFLLLPPPTHCRRTKTLIPNKQPNLLLRPNHLRIPYHTKYKWVSGYVRIGLMVGICYPVFPICFHRGSCPAHKKNRFVSLPNSSSCKKLSQMICRPGF